MPLVAHLSFRFCSITGGWGNRARMYICQYFIVMVSLAALPPKIDFQSLPRCQLSSDSSRHFRHNITIVIIRSCSLPYTQKLTLELPISKAISTSLCVRPLQLNVFIHYECLAGMKNTCWVVGFRRASPYASVLGLQRWYKQKYSFPASSPSTRMILPGNSKPQLVVKVKIYAKLKQSEEEKKKIARDMVSGETGDRTPDLPHAKRMLYHWAISPWCRWHAASTCLWSRLWFLINQQSYSRPAKPRRFVRPRRTASLNDYQGRQRIVVMGLRGLRGTEGLDWPWG